MSTEQANIESNDGVREGMDSPVLTAEQQAAVTAWLLAHPYGDQDENGIDLSLLRENMRLSPAERLSRLQHSLDFLAGIPHAIHTN